MTHSPTPAERMALRVGHAALAMSANPCSDIVSQVVVALGSAQLLMDPETAAELGQLGTLRARIADLETTVAAMHAAAVGEEKAPLLGLVVIARDEQARVAKLEAAAEYRAGQLAEQRHQLHDLPECMGGAW